MCARFRIATYNIHKGCGLDRQVRPERIIKVLREIDADVIALQEVLNVEEDPQRNQARLIAGELGFHSSFGENRRLYGGGYGNLLLSRFPIYASHNYDITAGQREARGCLRADIEIAESTLHLFNVHLGTHFLERRQQGRELVSPRILLSSELRGPRVVLGDFNEWTRGLASRLLSGCLRSIPIQKHLNRSRTYPGIFPVLHLDHMYCDESVILERLMLHRSRTSLIASDHLPLVGDFRLNLANHRNDSRVSAVGA